MTQGPHGRLWARRHRHKDQCRIGSYSSSLWSAGEVVTKCTLHLLSVQVLQEQEEGTKLSQDKRTRLSGLPGGGIQLDLAWLLGLFQAEGAACTKVGRPERTQWLQEWMNQIHMWQERSARSAEWPASHEYGLLPVGQWHGRFPSRGGARSSVYLTHAVNFQWWLVLSMTYPATGSRDLSFFNL